MIKETYHQTFIIQKTEIYTQTLVSRSKIESAQLKKPEKDEIW